MSWVVIDMSVVYGAWVQAPAMPVVQGVSQHTAASPDDRLLTRQEWVSQVWHVLAGGRGGTRGRAAALGALPVRPGGWHAGQAGHAPSGRV